MGSGEPRETLHAMDTTIDFPLPGAGDPVVAIPAPGKGSGWWAGAPAAVLDADNAILLAYRTRNGHDGHDETVVARSADGETYEPLVTLREERFDAMGVERPALVRLDDGWRLYVCCAIPDSKAWWIGALDAPTIEELGSAEVVTAFAPGREFAVKDPIVRRSEDGWEAWICCHHLDVPGHEDRMCSRYATSDDGLSWTWRGTVMSGTPGTWDARGARLTAIGDGYAAYDGRASAEENWFERTGIAARGEDGVYAPTGPALADVRYLEVLDVGGGARRIFYEARLPDESHELRTELITG